MALCGRCFGSTMGAATETCLTSKLRYLHLELISNYAI